MPNNTVTNSSQEQISQKTSEIPMYLQGKISLEIWDQFTYEQKAVLVSLEQQLPSQLSGVVPESIWSTLSPDQKLEFVFSHGLIPRFEIIQDPSATLEQYGFDGGMESTEALDPAESTAVEISMTESNQTRNEFTEEVYRVKQLEDEHNNASTSADLAPEISADDLKQIDSEQGKNLLPITPRFSGYNPSAAVVTNYKSYSSGKANKATTWISVMIQKFLESINVEKVE